MRVLLLSIYYPPEIGANARIVEGLGQQLIELGDEVTVVTGFPHYPDGVIQPDYRGKFLLRQQLNSGIRLIRSWLIAAPRERKWFRIANYLSFALSGIVGGLLAGRHDVMYVYSPPLFLGFTAYALSCLRQTPFVLNVQDIYPDIAIRHGMISSKILIRALEGFERWVYQKATHVTVISKGFRQNLIRKGVAPEKVTVIPNWVETHLFTPRSKDNSFSQEFGLLGERFVVMYAGNIGHSQGLETVVEAARLLRDEPGILFVIVGDGVRRREIVDLARSYGLDNMVFVPYQPRERMADVLASADVSLVILKPDKSKNTIQSKTYEIMALEKPIIGSVDADGDNWKLIAEAEAGVWAKPGSPDSLAECVRSLYADPDHRGKLGKNGRRYVEAYNTSRIAGMQYRALLRKVAEHALAR